MNILKAIIEGVLQGILVFLSLLAIYCFIWLIVIGIRELKDIFGK